MKARIIIISYRDEEVKKKLTFCAGKRKYNKIN